MGEGLLYEVDELVMKFVMACNDDTPVLSVEFTTHAKGLREATIFLEVRGVGIFFQIHVMGTF